MVGKGGGDRRGGDAIEGEAVKGGVFLFPSFSFSGKDIVEEFCEEVKEVGEVVGGGEAVAWRVMLLRGVLSEVIKTDFERGLFLRSSRAE